ncbi:MAG: YceI family protein [Bacteroidetes bacterium]|nr:YceI family protein [Bacteroidota bacterium]
MKTKKIFYFVITAFIITAGGCSDNSGNKTNSSDQNNIKEKNNTTQNKSIPESGEKKEISKSDSRLEWTAEKVTGKHNGTVDITGGELFIDKNKITGGNFNIDFSTIKVLDIEDSESNAKLTNHLKSDDFFSVEKYPLGNFDITGLKNVSGNKYEITGNMTIKGIKKQITFPAEIEITDGKISAKADFNIDRTLWDIKFRSGKFFENLGDKLISDEFNIKLNINTL